MAVKDEKGYWEGCGTQGDKPKMPIIKELAQEKGMTISSLSERCGVPRQTLYNYINGESRPFAIKLYKIAKALDTTVDFLLENRQEQDKAEDNQ